MVLRLANVRVKQMPKGRKVHVAVWQQRLALLQAQAAQLKAANQVMRQQHAAAIAANTKALVANAKQQWHCKQEIAKQGAAIPATPRQQAARNALRNVTT
jgi:dihydroxyacetone kinase